MKDQDYFELERTMFQNQINLIDELSNINGKNKSLLDLGCGKGVLSESIKQGFDVTSIDYGDIPYEKNIKLDLKNWMDNGII